MIESIKIKKIFFIMLILIIANLVIISPAYATADDIIEAGKDFLSVGKTVEGVIDTGELKKTSDYIFNVLLVIAVIIAVGIGTILGIKFITSSVEEQAKIKEALVPYLVGCVVIFSAFPIWSMIVNFGQEASDTDLNEENYFYWTCEGCKAKNSRKKSKFDNWERDGKGYYDGIMSCSGCNLTYLIDLEDYLVKLMDYPNCDACGKSLKGTETMKYSVIKEINEKDKFTIQKCSHCKKELVIWNTGNYNFKTRDRSELSSLEESVLKAVGVT